MIHLGDQVRDIEQDLVAAERLFRRGLEVLTPHVGENSIRLLHGLNSLADLLGRLHNNEAESLLRRALSISRSATGPGHPRVADQLHKLAGELARQDRLAEAEAMARQALELSIDLVGPRHQAVTTARLPLLAHILDLQRRYEDADGRTRWRSSRCRRHHTPWSARCAGSMV